MMGTQNHSPTDPFEIARTVAEAVRALPEVAALGSGRYAEAATYGPDGRVRGVVVRAEPPEWLVEVHLVARYSAHLDLEGTAARVRAQVSEALARRGVATRVDVFIDDITV